MARALQARLAAIERASKLCATAPTTVYVLGGCRDVDTGPVEAHGEGREWISALGETFAAFRARIQQEALGVPYLIFSGQPFR